MTCFVVVVVVVVVVFVVVVVAFFFFLFLIQIVAGIGYYGIESPLQYYYIYISRLF